MALNSVIVINPFRIESKYNCGPYQNGNLITNCGSYQNENVITICGSYKKKSSKQNENRS